MQAASTRSRRVLAPLVAACVGWDVHSVDRRDAAGNSRPPEAGADMDPAAAPIDHPPQEASDLGCSAPSSIRQTAGGRSEMPAATCRSSPTSSALSKSNSMSGPARSWTGRPQPPCSPPRYDPPGHRVAPTARIRPWNPSAAGGSAFRLPSTPRRDFAPPIRPWSWSGERPRQVPALMFGRCPVHRLRPHCRVWCHRRPRDQYQSGRNGAELERPAVRSDGGGGGHAADGHPRRILFIGFPLASSSTSLSR
jgi:hypothetical protein